MKSFKLNLENKIESGFQVPDHYFDDFHLKMITKVNEKDQKVISIWSSNKKYFYNAVAILVISLTIPFANHFKSKDLSKNVELENYLSNNCSGINDEIIDSFDETDITNIEVSKSIDSELIKEVLFETREVEYYVFN